MSDSEFLADQRGLRRALDIMCGECERGDGSLPACMPESGLGSYAALDLLAPTILGLAADLKDTKALAHMDPPTPWIAWAATLWNASLNQNLLHPATAPVARMVEQRVVEWLAPYFGMTGGHMTPGSTVANLTALWAARECVGAEEVIASESAHLSIAKAAHILRLRFRPLPTDRDGRLCAEALPKDMARTVLVLTAGTTSTGSIDPLELAGRAAWTHVDTAWAGPLRLTRYAERLAGIERADSVSVSAHKWLFQPKESALIFFREAKRAHAAISFGSAYLAAPNVGLLGSHGAVAVPLLATILSWGRDGLAARIEHCLSLSERLAQFVLGEQRLSLFMRPQTGIVVWRPRDPSSFQNVSRQLPKGTVSLTRLAGEEWFRNVAANPNADIDLIIDSIREALDSQPDRTRGD